MGLNFVLLILTGISMYYTYYFPNNNSIYLRDIPFLMIGISFMFFIVGTGLLDREHNEQTRKRKELEKIRSQFLAEKGYGLPKIEGVDYRVVITETQPAPTSEA